MEIVSLKMFFENELKDTNSSLAPPPNLRNILPFLIKSQKTKLYRPEKVIFYKKNEFFCSGFAL